MTKNIAKKVCKELNSTTLLLKQQFQSIKQDDIILIDIALKQLLEARNIIDFASHKQYTPNDWNTISKGIV